MKKNSMTYHGIDPAKIKTLGETEKAVVAYARYSQEPDEDTLGKRAKSVEDWERTDGKFMSMRLRIIAGEFYRRTEGKQLDQRNKTLCPGSRVDGDGLPYLLYNPNDDRVNLLSCSPVASGADLGVRRVKQMEV